MILQNVMRIMTIEIPKHIRLLIIEDIPNDQLGILEAIKKSDINCDVVMAVSVKEAQYRLSHDEFDLIICEYQLRDGMVFDLLANVRGIPIIVITRLNNEATAFNAMKEGIYEYLIKDPSGQYLVALPIIIQSVLRRKQIEIQQHTQATITLQNAQTIATMAERQRLARDLHDSVTQTLFAIAMTTQAIVKQWKQDPHAVGDSLEELQDLSQGALAEIRTLLLELRPSALLEADLGDLVRQLCTTMKGRSRLRVNFSSQGKANITPEAHVAFFRIAQESLNNIIKHSRAKKADIHLTRKFGRVELLIQDDGIGFNPQNVPPSHLGLKIMQERALDANIILSITSTHNIGTQVLAVWTQKEV